MKDDIEYIGDLFAEELGGLELTPPAELGASIVAGSSVGLVARVWLKLWVKVLVEFVILALMSVSVLVYSQNRLPNSQLGVVYASDNNLNEKSILNSPEEHINEPITNIIEPTLELETKSVAAIQTASIENNQLVNTSSAELIETTYPKIPTRAYKESIEAKTQNIEDRTAAKVNKHRTQKQSASETVNEKLVSNSVQQMDSKASEEHNDKLSERISSVVNAETNDQINTINTGGFSSSQEARIEHGAALSSSEMYSESMSAAPFMQGRSYSQLDGVESGDLIMMSTWDDFSSDFHRAAWAVSIYAANVQPTFKYTTSNVELIGNAQAIDNATAKVAGNEYGLRLERSFKRWSLQTGVSYLQINWKENSLLSGIYATKDSSYTYSFTPVTTIDTVDTYYSISGMDTTLNHLTSEIITQHKDSLLEYTHDTLEFNNDTVFSNSFSYVEIPLIFAYSMQVQKVQVLAKTGIIGGFLQKQSGASLYGRQLSEIHPMKKDHFAAVNLDVYVGLELRYPFTHGFFLFGDLYYRKGMTVLYEQQSINRKMNQAGVKVGLGMNF